MIAAPWDYAGELPPVLRAARDSLSERVRQIAHDSRQTEIDEDAVAELENDARGIAYGLHREPFSPETNPEDAFRQQQDEDDRKLLIEADNAEAYALAEEEGRRDAVATLPDPGPAPTVAEITAWTAVIVIAIVLGVTFHDRFFIGISDWAVRWAVSLLLGAVPGGLVTAFMLATYRSGRRTAANWLGLAAGLIIGVGAFLIRISDASGPDERLVTWGLTALEVSVVIFLEIYAHRLRSDYAIWHEQMSARLRAIQLRDEGEKSREERRQRLERIRQRRDEYRQYLEERRIRAMPIDRLQEIIVSAVRPAYKAGVDHWRSIRMGQIRRVP